MDAHFVWSQLQKTQNLAVTSDRLIMQNEEPEKVESLHFYSTSKPTDTSKTIQIGEPYQGTVKCMHFQLVRVNIILFYKQKRVNTSNSVQTIYIYMIIERKPI